MSVPKNAIEPKRSVDYAEWYQKVIEAADLAEVSPVRGCMVIKPWGYAIWENMQRILDDKIKKTGHKNAYFPLFIPVSYFEKEAQHVEGFAKECAVVTHSRLEVDKQGELVPAGPLEEPLVVRPTSELIIGDMFSRWIHSYRDLPLLINQWANVVRWEMRTRLFLRTTEFLWQEGHTAHATAEEASQHAEKMLGEYVDFTHNYLAIPTIPGEKTESERFPGAVKTFTIEAMMQDRKALQGGTSHFLGQNFAKANKIQFTDKDGEQKLVWTTSWGITTRLIGALVMTHGDDDGMVIPPALAPVHVVILPILRNDDSQAQVLEYCTTLNQQLESQIYKGQPVRVECDTRDMRGGDKLWEWIKKGVPVYVEVGPRDIAANNVFVGYRDKGVKERISLNKDQFVSTINEQLSAMQDRLFQKALAFRQAHTVNLNTKEELYAFFTPKNTGKPEIHGGFAHCHWNGSAAVEEQLKKDLKITIRCIPLEGEKESGKCIITGELSTQRVIFAKSY
jgi:prolyl-tRNA synthetase